MGLYLCIFDQDEEIEGVDIGSYSDFGWFRGCITRELEGDDAGSRFPTLILHHDSDGEWTPDEAGELEKELATISEELPHRPPVALFSDWHKQVAMNAGLRISSLYDCFFDVDGEPLLERLGRLANLSQKRNLPILFQ